MEQKAFLQQIEILAPLKGACSWDKSGIQIISSKEYIRKCVVALDPTLEVIDFALSVNADCIITHHPLDLKSPALHKEYYLTPIIRSLLQHDILLYSAHTSLDSTIHSISGYLAQLLELEDIQPLETIYSEYLHAVTLYIDNPADCIQLLEQHDISIESQFKNSCNTIFIHELYLSSVHRLLSQHSIPYTVTRMPHALRNFGIGCIGKRRTPILTKDLLELLTSECFVSCFAIHGSLPEELSTIAYCPGAGSSFITQLPRDTDIYITGEIKHHEVIYSSIPLLDVGHFSLEEKMMHVFMLHLQHSCPNVDIIMYPSKAPFTYTAL